MKTFISHLLSENEIARAETRWKIAQTFLESACSQNEAKRLHKASNDLVRRVHQETAIKKEVGYRLAFQRLRTRSSGEEGQQ